MFHITAQKSERVWRADQNFKMLNIICEMFYDVVADPNFKMLNIIHEMFTRDVINIIHLFTLIYKKSKGPHYLLISIIVSSAQLSSNLHSRASKNS